jgi:hypothetical protein
MTGWAERASDESTSGGVNEGGPFTLVYHVWVWKRPALPCQLSSSEPKARWYRKSQVRSTFLTCSEPLIWDTPGQRGASGSEALACHISDSVLISAPACPLQLGWASLISHHAARSLALPPPPQSSVLLCMHFILHQKLSGFQKAVLWKPRLACNCECCYWNSYLDSWAESSEGPHGEGAGFASCRLGLTLTHFWSLISGWSFSNPSESPRRAVSW